MGENGTVHNQNLKQKQAESRTKVHVEVKSVSVETKQLKSIKISTFIFVGVRPYFDVKYACLFPICNGYHQTFQWI